MSLYVTKKLIIIYHMQSHYKQKPIKLITLFLKLTLKLRNITQLLNHMQPMLM